MVFRIRTKRPESLGWVCLPEVPIGVWDLAILNSSTLVYNLERFLVDSEAKILHRIEQAPVIPPSIPQLVLLQTLFQFILHCYFPELTFSRFTNYCTLNFLKEIKKE